VSKKNFIEYVYLAEYMIGNGYPVYTTDVRKLAEKLEQLDNDGDNDNNDHRRDIWALGNRLEDRLN
jgi:hypothetical protein